MARNFVLPTVYQVNYNIVARHGEEILFPLLKRLGFDQIQSYSPLAGGFLTKVPEEITSPVKGGRWDPGTMVGKLYHGMYNKPSLIRLLKDFKQLSLNTGLSQSSLANRWVRYHSMASSEQDQIVIGARTVNQLEETLSELEEGPLDKHVVDKINGFWDLVKADAPVDNHTGWSKLAKEKL